jgi:alanyl-tRNA synthetase
MDTARNHSGTHLLHAALRQVLGPHVRQAGSLVAPDRLRFDFSHISPLSRDEMMDVQGLVSRKVRDNLTVHTHESGFTQAVQEGALAFFGDRYGDMVRVVEMSDGDRFSLEVCGGTHVMATGQIGPLFVVGESSIGGGMRRIEAVTGRAAEELFVERTSLLESISQKLQVPLGDLEGRLDSYIQESDRLRKQVAALERENLRREAQELLTRVQQVDGMKVLAAKTSASSADAMREMGDWLKAKLSSGIIVLAAVHNGRPTIIAMVTPDLVLKGLHAGNIARETASVVEGGGGGRPEIAQAGGRRADKLDEALRQVPEVVRKGLS